MKVEVNGININYEVSGTGKDLILLHGWGGSINSFAPVHKHCEKFFRTYSIDFPGFGESDEPKEVWGVEEYTDVFCGFMKKLNIKNPIIIGHSFGGRVAICSASKYQFTKIILVDSAGIKPKRSMKYYVKVYTYKTVKKILQLPVLKNIFSDYYEKYKNKAGSEDYRKASEMMKKILVKVVNEDLQGYLGKIKVPTLLIWGENDTATPVRDAKIMEKLIPDAGLVIFEGAGHFSYLEQFNRFIAIVENFLQNEMEEQ